MEILKFVYQHPLFETADFDLISKAHQRIELAKGDFLLKKIRWLMPIIFSSLDWCEPYLYDYEGNEITTGLQAPMKLLSKWLPYFSVSLT